QNISQAARGSMEISHNITAVAQAAQSTAEGASHTRQAAGELARMAAQLQALVAQFQYDGAADGQPTAAPGANGHGPAGHEAIGASLVAREEGLARPNGRSQPARMR